MDGFRHVRAVAGHDLPAHNRLEPLQRQVMKSHVSVGQASCSTSLVAAHLAIETRPWQPLNRRTYAKDLGTARPTVNPASVVADLNASTTSVDRGYQVQVCGPGDPAQNDVTAFNVGCHNWTHRDELAAMNQRHHR
jgi:hypothetical protein